MATNTIKGLGKNSRSPGSIANAEHHDPTGAARGMDGVPLSIGRILADSTAAADNAVRNHATLRIFNTDVAVQYVWCGKEDEVPLTVDITTGIAIAPGTGITAYSGYSDDQQKSLVIKTSNAAVQVVVMEG